MGLRGWLVERWIRRLPMTPPGRAADGSVGKLAGALEFVGEPLTAPLTARVCACFLLTVESGDERRGGWTEIWREEERRPFVLRDASGAGALVRADHARLLLAKDVEARSGIFEPPTAQLADFLDARGIRTRGWVFNRQLRVREAVIAPGQRVAAVGVARWESSADPGATGGAYREPPRRLVVAAGSERALIITNRLELIGR
jgi:hypothetical protein